MSILQTLRAWFGRSHAGRDTQEPDRPGAQVAAGSTQTPIAVVDLEAAYSLHEAGARFIDVREPAEWNDGHIAGAVHYPLGALEEQPEIPVTRDAPVVTYCAAGARAARAASALAANGYTHIQALQSGYADWAAAEYPVEHPDQDPAA